MHTTTKRSFLRYLPNLVIMTLLLITAGSGIALAEHPLGDLKASASEPVVEFLWQANGAPDVPLIHPAGVAVDPRGNLWVADSLNGWFVIFSPEGVVLETWGTRGNEDGQFEFQCHGEGGGDVAFDAAGNIYVADAGNGRIQKFAPDRTFLTSWLSEGRIVDSQLLVTGRGTQGVVDRPPLCPGAIAVDGQGRVVVSDRGASKIEVFDPGGRPLATGTETSMRPEGVALDSAGTIWVADNGNRVLQFTADAQLLAQWDLSGRGDTEYSIPLGIAVDRQGRVFVSDQRQRVQVFALDGTFIGAWGSPGVAAGQFTDPVGLALDGQGHVYVIEYFGSRLQKFRLLPPLGPA
jgi:DNA-binding beta-propeller fold protein YncE